jgi:hypothetical protein
LLSLTSAKAGPVEIPGMAIGSILDMVQRWLLEVAAVSGIRAARCISPVLPGSTSAQVEMPWTHSATVRASGRA